MIKICLDNLSIFSPILPLIIGVRKRISIIWIYILVNLIFNILIAKFFRDSSIKYLLANVYVFLEFFIISVFFFKNLKKEHRWIIYLGCGALCFAVYNTLSSGIYAFNGFSAAVLCFFYIMYCVLALYTIMVDSLIAKVFESPFFLITIGLFIYFSGMFMLFSTDNYFKRHELLWGFKVHSFMSGIWMINACCNIIQALIFARAFWIRKYSK